MAPSTVIPLEPTLSDIRAFVAPTTPAAPAKEPEPKTVTSEPAAGTPATEEKTPAAATEPAEPKKEPELQDEPLPEGVQKRIAKEAEKAARIQSEIDRAVSERKAKEAELNKLKETAPGSEPATKTPPAATEKPKRPVFGEKGHDTETWEQYEARGAAYEEARDKWLKTEAVREFQQQQQQTEAQRKAAEKWDAAVKKHGADFPALMDSARALAPEGLQLAISEMEHWDTVAVHLAKNPATLTELANTFKTSPYKAIATLGRIEAALTASSVTKPAATTEKPLPEPLAKVGGTASVSTQTVQDTIEKGSISAAKAAWAKARGK